LIFLESPEDDDGNEEDVIVQQEAARTLRTEHVAWIYLTDEGEEVFQSADYAFQADSSHIQKPPTTPADELTPTVPSSPSRLCVPFVTPCTRYPTEHGFLRESLLCHPLRC